MCVPVYVVSGKSTTVGLLLLPILVSPEMLGAMSLTIMESVWKIGDFRRSTLITPVDPVESLVG